MFQFMTANHPTRSNRAGSPVRLSIFLFGQWIKNNGFIHRDKFGTLIVKLATSTILQEFQYTYLMN